jgi:hypothetical protein
MINGPFCISQLLYFEFYLTICYFYVDKGKNYDSEKLSFAENRKRKNFL